VLILGNKPMNMNDIFRNIYERRAVRKYKAKAVDKKTIEQLIDAARMAPSAMNKQPWKFYIATKQDEIQYFSKEISKSALKHFRQMGIFRSIKTIASSLSALSHGLDFFKTEDPVFHNAPIVIFITAPKKNEWAGLDIGMCAQNIMLAAQSLGLASCPVGFGKFIMKTKAYPKLGIPKEEQVHIALIIGYGDETPKVHDRKKDNLFWL
jgi:nitroreductase